MKVECSVNSLNKLHRKISDLNDKALVVVAPVVVVVLTVKVIVIVIMVVIVLVVVVIPSINRDSFVIEYAKLLITRPRLTVPIRMHRTPNYRPA